ncbi:MAG: class I SAM-dependent methyltransferase, partial [Bradyrhizobium sp.]|nr:class I SAM-dependent methyltransferase [Bradyrhizobium sp.]
MGAIAEALLYSAAKRLYRTEVAHTSEMKAALSDLDAYDRYREGEADKVIQALRRYSISLAGKRVVDFGCNDGALSSRYLKEGAREVIGLDIDAKALERARLLRPGCTFLQSGVDSLPLPDASVDLIVSFDVFEHVEKPEPILAEMRRVLAPGGQVVIGTIGWWMPFAPHLWATMPVPWAHVLTSERSLLRACRRVYHS